METDTRNLPVLGESIPRKPYLVFIFLMFLLVWVPFCLLKNQFHVLLFQSTERNISERKACFGAVGKTVKILVYGQGTKHFHRKCCHGNVCEFAKYTREHYNKSDVLLIIPKRKYINSFEKIPAYKLPHHLWVFYLFDPDIHHGVINLTSLNGLINLTMTYNSHSDITLGWGRVIKRDSIIQKQDRKDYSKEKSKLVAWFVSHCTTPSKREDYVRELQRYIAVDIYGACGPLKCPKWSQENHTDICSSMLSKNYKFYLAFENSICEEYITEKIWTKLRLNVVPIVLGGGKYKEIFPSNSYIDISDFKGPQQLAKYLQLLDRNPHLYNKYFEWKNKYTIKLTVTDRLCTLCKFLHNGTSFDGQKSYSDLEKWWTNQRNCTHANLFYQYSFPRTLHRFDD